MKIKMMPQDLLRPISIVQRAISGKNALRVLECIHFHAGEGQLRLRATDLEIFTETSVPCIVEEEGDILLESTLIGNIIRKLPSKMLTLSTKMDTADLDCGDAHYHLQAMPATQYVAFPEKTESETTTLSNTALKQAIRQTEFAVSLDETKPALTGIFWERLEKQINLVSLDGYRMTVRTLSLSEENAQKEEIIVPKRPLMDLLRFLDDEETTVVCRLPNYILFESGNTKLFSRLIDKKYFNYRQILREDGRTTVRLSRTDFQDALERVSLVNREEHANLVKLRFTKDRLEIAADSEIGHVTETMPISLKGSDLLIAFNAKYLLDGLRVLDSAEILLTLNGALDPMLLHPAEEVDLYTYLVLPVSMSREN